MTNALIMYIFTPFSSLLNTLNIEFPLKMKKEKKNTQISIPIENRKKKRKQKTRKKIEKRFIV